MNDRSAEDEAARMAAHPVMKKLLSELDLDAKSFHYVISVQDETEMRSVAFEIVFPFFHAMAEHDGRTTLWIGPGQRAHLPLALESADWYAFSRPIYDGHEDTREPMPPNPKDFIVLGDIGKKDTTGMERSVNGLKNILSSGQGKAILFHIKSDAQMIPLPEGLVPSGTVPGAGCGAAILIGLSTIGAAASVICGVCFGIL